MYCVRLIFLGLILISISAAPFNYQEERKNVLEEIIHWENSSMKENVLIDKVVEARKIKAEEQQKVKEANKRADLAEREIEILKEFIRRLYCPTEMRFSIERFVSYLQSASVVMMRMGTLQKELGDLVFHALKNLTASVQSISSKATKFTDVEQKHEESLENEWLNSTKSALFNKYWSKLKETLSCTVMYSEVCQSVQHDGEKQKKSLIDLVFKLACAENIAEAQKLYLSEMSLWNWAKLDRQGKRDMKSLSYNEIFLRVEYYDEHLKIIENEKEKNFSDVILNIERHFEDEGGKTRDAQYNECMAVLYFSQHYSIKHLWEVMEKINVYPDEPYYLKGVRYCEDQSRLNNMISNINMHTAGEQPPSVDCKPNEENFVNFLRFLNQNHGKGMELVAKNLYGGLKERIEEHEATRSVLSVITTARTTGCKVIV